MEVYFRNSAEGVVLIMKRHACKVRSPVLDHALPTGDVGALAA